MLSSGDYIKQSLALHLFFARIMKEHAFFLEASFTPKDQNLTNQADYYRRVFDSVLNDVVTLSNGVVDQSVLSSGEVITPYTLRAEQKTISFTGVQLQTSITQAEAGLTAGGPSIQNPDLEQHVYTLNENVIKLVTGLIQLKNAVLSDVTACKLFTSNYPLLLDHILREAHQYLSAVQKLQRRMDANLQQETLEQEVFWNRIMSEHALFERGLFDPTENDLIGIANQIANQFNQLYAESVQAQQGTVTPAKVTADSLKASAELKGFNEARVQGVLFCGVKSIILPLLADHILRESNHYLRLLNMFSR